MEHGAYGGVLDYDWNCGGNVVAGGIYVFVGISAGGRGVRACGVSATAARAAWDRKASGGDHAAESGAGEVERVGLRRIHVCLDRRHGRALSGARWGEGLLAAGFAGVARGL